MEQDTNYRSTKRLVFYVSLVSFLAVMFMLLIGIPIGSFYDLIMLFVVLTFLCSSTTSIIFNSFHLIVNKKHVNIIHIVVPALLLLCLIIYVLYVINDDYPN